MRSASNIGGQYSLFYRNTKLYIPLNSTYLQNWITIFWRTKFGHTDNVLEEVAISFFNWPMAACVTKCKSITKKHKSVYTKFERKNSYCSSRKLLHYISGIRLLMNNRLSWTGPTTGPSNLNAICFQTDFMNAKCLFFPKGF